MAHWMCRMNRLAVHVPLRYQAQKSATFYQGLQDEAAAINNADACHNPCLRIATGCRGTNKPGFPRTALGRDKFRNYVTGFGLLLDIVKIYCILDIGSNKSRILLRI